MASPLRVLFSAADVDYLVLNLSEAQLRSELRNHDVQRACEIAERWPQYLDGEDFYWYNYGKACQLAIEIIASMKPKPKRIPGKVDIEQVKAVVDIVDVIGRHTRLREQGRNFVGCCPIHNDKHPSLTVYADQQRWHCYGCNRGGDAIDFIMAAENLDFKQAIATLAGVR